jgi:hypothetical protein
MQRATLSSTFQMKSVDGLTFCWIIEDTHALSLVDPTVMQYVRRSVANWRDNLASRNARPAEAWKRAIRSESNKFHRMVHADDKSGKMQGIEY